VVAPAGRGPAASRGLRVDFVNNGSNAATWRSLPLSAPFAVAGGSQVAVSHSCGGQSYTAGVRQDTGAAIVALRVDTFEK
jgi:hypothetical protein